MKKLIEHYKKEDGVVAVVVALLMVALLSFASLAVDLGAVYYKKNQLQATLDAAALAAVNKLPDASLARATALEYITKNGFSTDGVDITIANNNKTIRVGSAQQAKTYFANVFGVRSKQYSCYAKAMLGSDSAGGVFDYLLFSGSKTETLTLGANFNIYGSVHSNGNFYASPSLGFIKNNAEATGTASINTYTCTVGKLVSGAPLIPMTDFKTCVDQVVPTTWENTPTAASINAMWWRVLFNGNTKIVGNVNIGNCCTITGNLYVDGNLTISGGSPVCILNGGSIYATGNINFGNTFQGDGCVFAEGSITFTGGNNTITPNKPICLYSHYGNITLTPASTDVYGIVYAPNGTVYIGGNNTTFHGSIIGNKITGIPAKLTMYSNEISLPFKIGTSKGVLISDGSK